MKIWQRTSDFVENGRPEVGRHENGRPNFNILIVESMKLAEQHFDSHSDSPDQPSSQPTYLSNYLTPRHLHRVRTRKPIANAR